jgi:hypothetical protein
MSLKKNFNGILRSLIGQYKPRADLTTYSAGTQMSKVTYQNVFINNQKVDRLLNNYNFQIPRGLKTPDLTTYSQENIGRKNN